MVRKSPAVLLTLLFFVAAMSAQEGPQMPKPGPEYKKLDYFAGDWLVHGNGTSGVKFTRKHHAYWLEGGFFLVSHDEWKSPAGNGAELTVMGYDPDEKMYTYHAFNSEAEDIFAKCTVNGKTWSCTSNQKLDGQRVKGRATTNEVSATYYTFKFEVAPEGTINFQTVMEGTATKVR